MNTLIGAIRELIEQDDRAALAALRRGLGKPPGTAGEMCPIVIPFLPDSTEPGWNWPQQCHFIVASLFAWHQRDWNSGQARSCNFGASVRRLLRQRTELRESGGPERRFVALLNAEREELPHHLRAMVGLLEAHEIPVDWEQLLRDLTRWSDEGRPVQIEWAKEFWGASRVSEEPDELAKEPTEAEAAVTG